MSETQAVLARKWIPMVGGSCDVRMGSNALERASKLLESSVAKPRCCMAVVPDDLEAELRELLRRQLVDAGFEVFWHEIPLGEGASLEEANRLFAALGEAGLTADDLCCALGDAELLSCAAYVCGSWCAGMSLAVIPTDEVAFFEGALAPRSLAVGSRTRMVGVRPCAKHVLLDYDLMLSEPDSEAASYARVLMVAAAMSSSEREFSALWDRAAELMRDDVDEYVTQLLDTAKARGKAMASTAASVRQSIDYGQVFAHAVESLVEAPVSHAVAAAEGLRFSARMAVLLEKLPLDDMLAQDELLEALGIGELECAIEPEALVAALKAERFERSNRFMLPVPLAIGRVRLTTIEDDMLGELAAAWCAAHAPEK